MCVTRDRLEDDLNFSLKMDKCDVFFLFRAFYLQCGQPEKLKRGVKKCLGTTPLFYSEWQIFSRQGCRVMVRDEE